MIGSDDPRHGQIWWTEYNTWDVDAAMRYYGPMMGWTFREAGTAGTDDARPYYIAMKGERMVAGFFSLTEPAFKGIPDHWFVYLSVADLASALDKHTIELGASVTRPPFEIPGFGIMAVVKDTTGGAFGMIEPAQPG